MTATVYAPLRVEQLALAGLGLDVRRCGMGARADATAAALANDGAPAVAVTGVAGAVQPHLQPGDVIVATEVRGDGDPVPCPSAELVAGDLRRAGVRVHTGPLQTVGAVVSASTERERIAATGALAVDMESYALARAAGGRPLAVVRTVADTPERGLFDPAAGVAGLRSLRRAAPVLSRWAAAIGDRELLLAGPRSFCAGVERAILVVERALDRYGAPVYVRKQIVHNSHVVADLERRGAIFVDELDEVPDGATVVFSAHGVAPAVRDDAGGRGLSVIDATCPLVSKVHAEARRFTGRGDTVLLIGHEGHEEVEGTTGEAPQQIVLVEDEEAARRVQVPDPRKVSYLMQTTLAVDDARRIVATLQQRFPDIDGPGSDDICYATTNRQDAVRVVARDSDLVVVVGSRNSSNSVRLVEVARSQGAPAYLIDDVDEICLDWLAGTGTVGITAGASAPPALVDRVIRALSGLGAVTVTERSVADETVHFQLPKEAI